MVSKFPKYGDIISVAFDPSVGSEQKGLRPAVVLSSTKYNQVSGFAICAPITSKEKCYPFEVKLQNTKKTKGVILVDQIKVLDLKARRFRIVDCLNLENIKIVKHYLSLLLEI
jgi:mRNA interferase MazF